MTAETLLSVLVRLTSDTLTARKVGDALDVVLEPAVSNDVSARFEGHSETFPKVEVTEARGSGTAAPRVHLELVGPCISFEAMKGAFGFAHAAPRHPGQPSAGERFQYNLTTGRLTVGYTNDCVRQVWFEGG